jgi:hypothetical protein
MDDGLDFALMEFEHTEGAEEAYSRAPRSVGGVAWADQVAFVEHHRRNRIIVRGTFAGRYVDADDELEFVGKKTAEGAIAGAAIGLFGGPVGLAVGLVGGGLASPRNAAPRTSAARSSTSCGEKCPRVRRPYS